MMYCLQSAHPIYVSYLLKQSMNYYYGIYTMDLHVTLRTFLQVRAFDVREKEAEYLEISLL